MELLRCGLPAGTQGAVDALTWGGIVVWFVGQFGEDHLAATAIALRLSQIGFLPSEGVGAALMALVGKATGAEKFGLADNLVTVSWRIVAAYMMTWGIFLALFGREIISLFSDEEGILTIGRNVLIVVGVFQIFDAMNIVYNHALLGVGDSLFMSLINILLTLTILIGLNLFLIAAFPTLGSLGVWYCVALYTAMLGLICRYRWHKRKWRKGTILSY